jgi:asparagine synthase (glutamine-hydrolysing)
MNYRYLAFVDHDNPGNPGKRLALKGTHLSEMGMEQCLSVGPVTVFVSKRCPRLLIPGHGVLIGHLFSRDGQPITEGWMLAQSLSYQALEKSLLDHYWGEYILIHFSGEQGLMILRDPSGGVPCFYSYQAGVGFITSNISIAIDLNFYRKRIDWDYIAQALTCPHRPTARTGLSDISQLLPSCALKLGGTCLAIQTSWSPWSFITVGNRHSDFDEAAAEIRRSVSTAVKSLAETDQGEILLYLSGGLDSSIVAACLRGVKARVTCITDVAAEFGADERQYARQMTDYLGVEFQAKNFTLEHRCFDFPVSPDAVFPIKATKEDEDCDGVTSFFSGNGGDAIFCYMPNAAPAADAFKERGLRAGLAAIKNLSILHRCTVWKAGRVTLRKLRHGARTSWTTDWSFLNPAKASRALPHHPWFVGPRDALPGDYEKIKMLVSTQSYKACPFRGENRLDRMPLLSQPVVEACLKVPTWMWISGGQNRAVARAAFADLLPKGILNRQDKCSYRHHTTAVYWKHKIQMQNVLLTGHLQAQKFLDIEALTQFFEKEDSHSSDPKAQDRIFDLCMFENWLRQQV